MEEAEFVQAVEEGDIEKLNALSVADMDQRLLETQQVQVAMMRSAERFVFHRPNHQKAVQKVIDLGTPCDIWTAARAGLIDHVKKLLAEQPDLLSAVDGLGRTPLQRAALIYGVCKECEEVADYLIAYGAVLDIFTASTFCLPDIVQQELQRNPDLVSERCQGSAPLNWAVRPRRNFPNAPVVCKVLIEAGANVHDRDEDEGGMTPLHHAAEWGPPICLRLASQLLEAGAHVNYTDDQGWTALDYAQDRKRSEMVNHLKASGAVANAT